MTLLLTRPEWQSKQSAERLRQLGFDTLIEPLLTVQKIQNSLPVEHYAGIIITSSNAIEALTDLEIEPDKPVITTGDSTATALHSAGFKNVTSAKGSALDLVARLPGWMMENIIPSSGNLLYPCATQVAHNLQEHVNQGGNGFCRIVQWPVYEALPVNAFSDFTQSQLSQNLISGVLLYSPKTAVTFAKLFAQLADNTISPRLYCLSKQVARALPQRLAEKSCYAPKPNEDSLFSLLTAT